jgi:1-acyl-sn-glycerol-3-phosphate acyltransferase
MNYFRAARNWGHVASRAIVYGTVGTAVGWIPPCRRFANWMMHLWCEGCCEALHVRRQLLGKEHLEDAPQGILVANHLSSLDILVLGSFLRRDFRWLAKSELFKVPFSGWYLSSAGHIRVHRGEDASSRNKSIREQIHRVMKCGASVLFFPEGKRSRDGELKPFRLGAFIAAIREDKPIIPLVIRGTHELMEPGAKDLTINQDRECSVTVLAPIPASAAGAGDEVERAKRLRDLTHAAIEARLREVAPLEMLDPADLEAPIHGASAAG